MRFVDKWWRAWSLRIAALGLAIPEILQIVADNTELLVFLPPDWRGYIYILALLGAVIARPIKQKNMDPTEFD